MADPSIVTTGAAETQIDAADLRAGRTQRPTLGARLVANLDLIRQHPGRHLMILIVIVWLIIFHYVPIYGITLAFKRFNPLQGFWGGEWVGFKYFGQFITDPNALRLIRNTVVLGFQSLIYGFPAPIIFAILLNELRHEGFKRTMQSLTYLPHFVSVVVIVGLMFQFVDYEGLLTTIIANITGERPVILTNPRAFRPLYIISGIWQGLGWGSIIYLAALTGVNPELYESADIDGTNRFQKIIYITLPSLLPTILILFILNTRAIVDVGFEKAFLIQNPATYETSDVIQTYVYRRGLQGAQYSYASAVGLINSVASFLIVYITNRIVKRVRGEGLW